MGYPVGSGSMFVRPLLVRLHSVCTSRKSSLCSSCAVVRSCAAQLPTAQNTFFFCHIFFSAFGKFVTLALSRVPPYYTVLSSHLSALQRSAVRAHLTRSLRLTGVRSQQRPFSILRPISIAPFGGGLHFFVFTAVHQTSS